MTDLVMASNNAHKIKELAAFLQALCPCDAHGEPFRFRSLKEIGWTAEIVEDGTTFEENALIKARTVAALGYIGVADDSGLCVDALHGEPGIYSARYAEGRGDEANNQKVLKNLQNTPDAERTAHFVSVIACVFPDGTELVARGECPGVILRDYRGENGFGYDPLFYYEPLRKTFAEMTAEEKNRVSHRARAMANFAELFAEEQKRRTGC